jgi:class 3 adenylate cyclase
VATGDVLATATTRDLVAGSGLVFAELGKHKLRGLDEARELFAAAAEGTSPQPATT